jgi:hypothetical protein
VFLLDWVLLIARTLAEPGSGRPAGVSRTGEGARKAKVSDIDPMTGLETEAVTRAA